LLNASTKASEWETKDYKDSCLESGFGTWKVRAVLRPELLKELIPQMKQYSLRVMAIQDTRWQGEPIIDLRTHMVLLTAKTK
jgi:hypothetical protein